jgi:hypothetical protein
MLAWGVGGEGGDLRGRVAYHTIKELKRQGTVAGGPEIMCCLTKPGLDLGNQNGVSWHKTEFLPGSLLSNYPLGLTIYTN